VMTREVYRTSSMNLKEMRSEVLYDRGQRSA
jgi:hypothetical protein